MRLKCFKKCLPCLLPELWLLKCEAWLFFVFSADDSKKLVRTWAKHLSTTERSSSVNMITRQMTPFFHLYTIWTLFVDTIHFCILRPSKFSSVRSPICFMFWSVKSTVLHAKDDNFKHKQEIYVMLSRFLPLKGCRWGDWVNLLIKETFTKKSCFR